MHSSQLTARTVLYIALVTYALAALVRVYWVLDLQSPFSAIVSDMEGYVSRARNLIAGRAPQPTRLQAFFPYGAHYYYAALFTSVGGELYAQRVIVLHALLGALQAPLFVVIAGSFITRVPTLMLLGAVLAFWPPPVSYVGFFSSEVPYGWLSALAIVLLLRFVQLPRPHKLSSLLASKFAGLFCGFSFAVRPEFGLVLALISPFLLVRTIHEWSARRWRHLLAFGLPLALIISFGVARLYLITGKWGLLSENGAVTRIFGETGYIRVKAEWTDEFGNWFFVVVPPQKHLIGDKEELKYRGYIGDSDILNYHREMYISQHTFFDRVRRWAVNIWMLIGGGPVWPELDYARSPLRVTLQNVSAGVVTSGLTPLALLGAVTLFLSRRRLSDRGRIAAWFIAAQLITIMYAGAVYYGEPRHRIPYDAALWSFAFFGIEFVTIRLLGWRQSRERH